MPELITEGHIYKAIPPLYKISTKDDFYYAYSDSELNTLKTKLKSKVKNIQRFKGLGEMKAEQLWETTMDPKTRKIIPVTLEDTKLAEEMTRIYMGTKVDDRKENIMNLATDENIDIDY